MDDSTKLAVSILIMFGAMVCFYFAFHPGKLAEGTIKDPNDALKWLITQFQTTAGVTPSASANG